MEVGLVTKQEYHSRIEPESNIHILCIIRTHTQTSIRCRFSARLTLERRTGVAFRCENMVGIASVLRGFNIRLDPSIRTSMTYDSLKQCSSKCFEHKRGFFGKDVLPIAWIHAWCVFLSFGNVWNRIFGSFCFLLAWTLHSKATQCGIFVVWQILEGQSTWGAKQPSYVTRPDCSARLVKMADSGRFEFATKAFFGLWEKFIW